MLSNAQHSDDDSEGDHHQSPTKMYPRGPADLFNLERPRSYSLPNMGFNNESDSYMYAIDRDFRAEIQ